MTWAILGSGFGLYGYLPAVWARPNDEIVLLSRYRDQFERRPELARFADKISWELDDDAAVERSTGLILSRRPGDNRDAVHRYIGAEHVKNVVIEKPICSTPSEAIQVQERLQASRAVFRIGYTFRYTYWAKSLLQGILVGAEVLPFFIEWRFMAHHFRNGQASWKTDPGEGGGVIRFYGIQLIALLAELGYNDVTHSVVRNSCGSTWEATFVAAGLPNFAVLVDARSEESRFRVGTLALRNTDDCNVTVIQQRGPFETLDSTTQILDPRVPLLEQLLDSFAGQRLESWYPAVNRLWAAVERVTIHAKALKVLK